MVKRDKEGVLGFFKHAWGLDTTDHERHAPDGSSHILEIVTACRLGPYVKRHRVRPWCEGNNGWYLVDFQIQ